MSALLLNLTEKNTGEEWLINVDSAVAIRRLHNNEGTRIYMWFSYNEDEAQYIDVRETKEQVEEIIDELCECECEEDDSDEEDTIIHPSEDYDLGDPIG